MSSDLDAALESFKATFFAEADEQLADVEERLGRIRADVGNVDAEDLHATFRAVHSVKGGAGAFEFTQVVDFSHKMETLLDLMRNGDVVADAATVDLLIAANDLLVELVEATRTDGEADTARVADLTARLLSAQGQATPAATPQAADSNGDDAPGSARRYRIDFRPNRQLFMFGNEPALLLRELKGLAESCEVHADLSALPSLDGLEPESCYLSWRIEVETARPVSDLEEVFEFVADDCHLDIAPLEAGGGEGAPAQAKGDAAGGGAEAGDGAPEDEAPRALATARAGGPSATSVAKSNGTAGGGPGSGSGGAETVTARQEGTSRGRGRGDSGVTSIRVELDRVDRLVNMVGELVITQAMLRQRLSELPAEHMNSMSQGFEDLDMHLRELQESVMAVRMQPVRSVFARMPRLVRDISGKLGKRVDLVMSGEGTEVDKTVIEQLADPLTHMIRNALDHGIEDAEGRVAAGKEPQATIWLNAEHKSGRIVITIEDDGRGINREKVLAKARERGIVAADAQLSNDEIDELIYAPGFSTADAVTDVSGRGVGMDVVRQNIVSLGGRLSVKSEPGQGTRFVMSLPLTLAVLDGMVVSVGSEYYIFPLTAIIETIHPDRSQIRELANGAEVIAARGDYIRLCRLYDVFGIQGAVERPEDALVVIAEVEGGGQLGILIDEMVGQQQVVIKSLEENYGHVGGIGAATILGSGRVALILDINGLNQLSRERAKAGRLEGAGQNRGRLTAV
jgi:two-component system chemotaxis sensor kinase CheA